MYWPRAGVLSLAFAVAVHSNGYSPPMIDRHNSTLPTPATSRGAHGQQLAFVGNFSEPCREAVASQQVQPDCGIIQSNSSFADTLPTLCHAPADGSPGHPCTPAQVSTAVQTLGARCSNELLAGDESVRALLENWVTYELSFRLLCLRDNTTGAYCAVKAGAVDGLPSDADEIGKLSCDSCTRATISTTLAWVPPNAADTYLNGSIQASCALLRKTADDQCGADWLATEESVTNTSPRTLFAGEFVHVVLGPILLMLFVVM